MTHNKFLEISLGQNSLPIRFEITEVEPKIFMLKTIGCSKQLVQTLDKLLQENYLMDEIEYEDMLWKRSIHVMEVLSEGVTSDFIVDQIDMTQSIIGDNKIRDEYVWDEDAFRQLMFSPRRNLEEMIEEADQADNLFFGCYKKLMQWSIRQEQVTKDYGDIMTGIIWSIVQTKNKDYLFLSDEKGCQKVINVKEQKVVKDYGQIHDNIRSIAITSDDKYLFTSDYEVDGHVKQFSLSDGQMIFDYGPIFARDGVLKITTTPDNKYLFAAGRRGGLAQISLESQQILHDYGQIDYNHFTCLETTRDSQWIITSNAEEKLFRISVETRKFAKCFGRVCDNWISTMKITADGKKLLVGDSMGHLKLISSRDGKVIKDFGQAHDLCITGIEITVDQKFFFTSSFDGELKQWNYEDKTLFRHHGKKTEVIGSLCF